MEYVKLEPEEGRYGKKHLLYIEMGALNVLKHFEEYKKLRKQELALKNALRLKIAAVQQECASLDKVLPKIKKRSPEIERVSAIIENKKRKDLEWEIEEIKRKIQLLQ